jgi:SAM-dependent methyltransferase
MRTELLKSCILCGSASIRSIDQKAKIYRCDGCGHIFNNPRPTSDEIRDYYAFSSTYDDWAGEGEQRNRMWRKRLAMVRRERARGSLLDVGAGDGHFLSLAKEFYDVTGTEISTKATERAREQHGIELIQGELQDIELEEGSFDVITVFHVLEHVPYPGAFITRCRELLREKGILFIAVPNDMHSMTSPMKRFLALLGIGKWKYYSRSGLPDITVPGVMDEIHLSHFKVSVLRKHMEDAGLSVQETTLDPYDVSTGFEGFLQTAFYWFCRVILKLFHRNIYDTIWIRSVKKG